MYEKRFVRWVAMFGLIAMPVLPSLPVPIELPRRNHPPVCPHADPSCPSPIDPQLLPSSQR